MQVPMIHAQNFSLGVNLMFKAPARPHLRAHDRGGAAAALED